MKEESFMLINPFKIRKVLLQTKAYVAEVNAINEELQIICKEQLKIIERLTARVNELEKQ